MNLVSTITGLPFVGKTTLFNLLTGGHASTGAFAGAEGETNVGVAKVADERIDKLERIVQAEEDDARGGHVPAILVSRTRPRKGRAISTQKLGDLRSSDLLVHVVRAFRDPSVPHVDATIDPVRDLSSLELELLFADHAVVEKRLERIEPEIRAAKGPEKEARERERLVLQKAMAALDTETPLRDIGLDDDERKSIRGYRFLTLQPQLVIANIDEVRRGETGCDPRSASRRRCEAQGNAASCRCARSSKRRSPSYPRRRRSRSAPSSGVTEPRAVSRRARDV